MEGYDNHKTVTSKDLAYWLFNEASDHGDSIWKQKRPTLRATAYIGPTHPDFMYDDKVITKADIINEVWATYSTDENTTGIYITGYSVGNDQSDYDMKQAVIAADIAYREAATPSDRVFKVFLEGDPDETNKGYFASNTVGEIVTFVIRTNVSIEEQPITINSRSATHTTPTSAVYDSTSDYYYYTFDVELTTVNSNNNRLGEVYSVTQGTVSSDVVVYIEGSIDNMSSILYTSMPYVYTTESSNTEHNWNNGGYTVTNFYKYSFVANIGNAKTVTFPGGKSTGFRYSTRSNIPGMNAAESVSAMNSFKINVPLIMNLNVGRRNFTSIANSSNVISLLPDSTTLFTMSMSVSGSTSYTSPYTNYFQTTGNVTLDTSFGSNGVQFNQSQLKAKLNDDASVVESGTLSIMGNTVVAKESTDWVEYNGASADPDVYQIEEIDNIVLNNAGNFKIIGYKDIIEPDEENPQIEHTIRRLIIGGNGSGNNFPTGYNDYVASFGDTLTGRVIDRSSTDDQTTERVYNIVRGKFMPYIQNQIYVDIPMLNKPSVRYEIDMPTEQATFDESVALCSIAYSFGSGVKCLDPDRITNRLWKPSLINPTTPIYDNLSEIVLCHVHLQDGEVPRCEEEYVRFRLVDSSSNLIEYVAYVTDIPALLNRLSFSQTLQIRITSVYDSSAKRHDELDPEIPVTIEPGFYYLDDKRILTVVTLDGNTPHFKFCTTGGKYANEQNGTVVATDINVESYSQAAATFDDVWFVSFTINGGTGIMYEPVFDGFVELSAGSSVKRTGRVDISYN